MSFDEEQVDYRCESDSHSESESTDADHKILQGTVLKYNQEKGFGFVSMGKQSVFFHVKDLRGDADRERLKGAKMSYKVKEAEKGLKAFELHVIQEGSGASKSSGTLNRAERRAASISSRASKKQKVERVLGKGSGGAHNAEVDRASQKSSSRCAGDNQQQMGGTQGRTRQSGDASESAASMSSSAMSHCAGDHQRRCMDSLKCLQGKGGVQDQSVRGGESQASGCQQYMDYQNFLQGQVRAEHSIDYHKISEFQKFIQGEGVAQSKYARVADSQASGFQQCMDVQKFMQPQGAQDHIRRVLTGIQGSHWVRDVMEGSGQAFWKNMYANEIIWENTLLLLVKAV
eukprot:TRINITY_DN4966_c0_g1_i1.p1 TRINITY_DN4966_c0_g1~~TRINITY_DN4966_c0_g1_i1.p1  ORF type:complete len:344 (+),score=71.29 TRINITY_DN4966_c0_g1_i1:53-1084(+)